VKAPAHPGYPGLKGRKTVVGLKGLSAEVQNYFLYVHVGVLYAVMDFVVCHMIRFNKLQNLYTLVCFMTEISFLLTGQFLVTGT